MTTITGPILAIDPGTSESGWAVLDDRTVLDKGIDDNERVLRLIRSAVLGTWVVIERIEPRYGQSTGWETIQACEWVGRFMEAAGDHPVALLNRSDVLRHLRIPPKANADSGVRAAVIDRFGGSAALRKGGALPRGEVKSHIWSALGLAVAWQEDCRASLIRREDIEETAA